MADNQPAVPFFKKGKSRPANNRKRAASPTGLAEISPGPSTTLQNKSEVVLPSRKQGPNLLSAGTKRLTSQRGEDLDDDAEDVRDGPDVKWTAAGSHQHAAREILAGDEAEELLARRNKKTRLNDDDDEDEHEERQGRYECKTGGKGEKRTIHVSRHRQDQSRMDTDFSEHEEVDATMAPISFNSQRTKSSKF